MKVLFVCYGNTCRSPYLMFKLKSLNSYIEFDSCGIFVNCCDLNENTKIVLNEKNLKYNDFAPKQIDSDLFNKVDYLIPVDSTVENELLKKFNQQNKIIPIKNIIGADLIDPYGKSIESYRLMGNIIDENANKILYYITQL